MKYIDPSSLNQPKVQNSSNPQISTDYQQVASTHQHAASTHQHATSTHQLVMSAHQQATSNHQVTSDNQQATNVHQQATGVPPVSVHHQITGVQPLNVHQQASTSYPLAVQHNQLSSPQNSTDSHIQLPYHKPATQRNLADCRVSTSLHPSSGTTNQPNSRTPFCDASSLSAGHFSNPKASTPSYNIPQPPIPGQLAEINIGVKENQGQPVDAVLSPVNPRKDPRALLPDPRSSIRPPVPVIPSITPTNSLLPEPISLLPNSSVLFSEPDSLMPDPSATTSAEDNSNALFRCASSHSLSRAKTQMPLLPEPDSLLPSPGGLLPAPTGLLPDPLPSPTHSQLSETHANCDPFRTILDEDDWKIISDPSAPISKRKSSKNSHQWDNSQEKHQRRDSTEFSHQKMPADSTSVDGD